MLKIMGAEDHKSEQGDWVGYTISPFIPFYSPPPTPSPEAATVR